MSSVAGDEGTTPPPFLRLAGHPIRWRLLTELARSDRRVSELSRLAGVRQSLVSYHLRQLRDYGLIRASRSAADGRDSYYTLEFARCSDALSGLGIALHPGLATDVHSGFTRREADVKARMLFLCTGNGARSQMAEALCEELSNGTVTAFSAGSHPKEIHPNAVRVMKEREIDIAGRRSKHLSEFIGATFHYVITLCDRVREVCPEFPGGPEVIHWSTRDPASESATDEETLPLFRQTADELDERICFLLCALEPIPPRKETLAHA